MPSPSFFGPKNGLDSKDYLLYMTEPGRSPVTRPVKLLAHSLTSPSQNLIDAVLYTTVEESGGVVRVVTRVKRAAQETYRTYTIGLPSAIWTPVMEQALNGNCPTTFFMIYLCPADEIYAHAFIFPDAYLNPPIEAEDVITNGEETNIITMTSEMQTTRKLTLYGLQYNIVYDAAAALYDIAFIDEDCRGCLTGGAAQDMIAVGGDGVAIPLVINTGNRFSSIATYTSGSVATNLGQAVYRKGDFILAAFLVEGTPDTGEIRRSLDGGTTWAVVGSYTEIIYDIFEVDGTFIFVGGDAVGGGAVAISFDQGSTITPVTSAALPAGAALRSIDYDPSTGRYYISGDSGTLLVGTFNGSTLSLNDISANLPGAPTILYRVLVRGDKEVVVGGASGYLAESHDSGVTFTELAIGTTSAIRGLAGNLYRLLVGAATAIFEQTVLTDYELRRVTLANGATIAGDITQIVMNRDDDFNRFAIITDDGEVVMAVPNYPNA